MCVCVLAVCMFAGVYACWYYECKHVDIYIHIYIYIYIYIYICKCSYVHVVYVCLLCVGLHERGLFVQGHGMYMLYVYMYVLYIYICTYAVTGIHIHAEHTSTQIRTEISQLKG